MIVEMGDGSLVRHPDRALSWPTPGAGCGNAQNPRVFQSAPLAATFETHQFVYQFTVVRDSCATN